MQPLQTPLNAMHTRHYHFGFFFSIVVAISLIPPSLYAQGDMLPNASTETVLHNFTGGADGGNPSAGLVFDSAGNLYGTTKSGGLYGHGTIFQLSPSGDGWIHTVLYSFTGGHDGDSPNGGLLVGNGSIIGTTYQGGDSGLGTLFELFRSSGTLSVIHSFAGGSDGAYPAAGVLDFFGYLYGTTTTGGVSGRYCDTSGCGTIFWWNGFNHYGVWNSFDRTTGDTPYSGLVSHPFMPCFLGTTQWGPYPYWGSVIADCEQEIYPIHSFPLRGKAGRNPLGGIAVDGGGSMFGTTSEGGDGGRGTVFGMGHPFGPTHDRPTKRPDAGYDAFVLYEFAGWNGAKPIGDLLLDADGNLYGTTSLGGANNQGVVFKLTPGLKGKWTETLLYNFTASDGANPGGSLVFDSADNLYGTTSAGGAFGAGVIFKVPNVRIGPQAILKPTSFNFSRQVIGTTSVSKTVTLSNTGDKQLTISEISVTPSGDFAIASNTCGGKLAPGGQCKVSVAFTPTFLGTVTATLMFSDNDPNSPQSVPLTGTGVLPATLMPASPSFPKTVVGTTSLPKTFTLTNNQTVTLDNIVISTTGDFAVSATTCATSLAAKSRCTIDVTFTPTGKGKRNGTLSVNDSASNSPQVSTLTGTGT